MFTTADTEPPAKWQFLGIQPITYQKCAGENPHQAITDSTAAWASETKRGLLEKAERIRGIASGQPPLEGEDADYIKCSLKDSETARIFFKHAKSPAWISWLEKHGLFHLFSTSGRNWMIFHRDFHAVTGPKLPRKRRPTIV